MVSAGVGRNHQQGLWNAAFFKKLYSQVGQQLMCGGKPMNSETFSTTWQVEFRRVWDRGLEAWHAGQKAARTMFSAEDMVFLKSIGCTAQELFDYVDDHLRCGDPDYETVLGVTEIRYRYLQQVLGGKETGRIIPMRNLPAKTAAVEGIAWLPRLIAKARMKLRGEMDPNVMYGCGGDRPFLQRHGMTLPQFLQLVWDQGDDDAAIVAAVKAATAAMVRR
jgi:hypothetical protein